MTFTPSNTAADDKAVFNAGSTGGSGSATIQATLDTIDEAYNYEGNTTAEITINVSNVSCFRTEVPGIAVSMTVTADNTTIDCTSK